MLKFPLDNYPEYKKECMTEEHHSQLLWLPPRAERVEESLALKKPKKSNMKVFTVRTESYLVVSLIKDIAFGRF